jgi:hypothetical protein
LASASADSTTLVALRAVLAALREADDEDPGVTFVALGTNLMVERK